MTTNQKYINAVFNFDAEAFKALLNTEPFDESLLHDINFSEGVPCPIYWMTQCWEIIFAHPEEWKENCRHIIEENKQRNLEIKRLFEEKLNVASLTRNCKRYLSKEHNLTQLQTMQETWLIL